MLPSPRIPSGTRAEPTQARWAWLEDILVACALLPVFIVLAYLLLTHQFADRWLWLGGAAWPGWMVVGFWMLVDSIVQLCRTRTPRFAGWLPVMLVWGGFAAYAYYFLERRPRRRGRVPWAERREPGRAGRYAHRRPVWLADALVLASLVALAAAPASDLYLGIPPDADRLRMVSNHRIAFTILMLLPVVLTIVGMYTWMLVDCAVELARTGRRTLIIWLVAMCFFFPVAWPYYFIVRRRRRASNRRQRTERCSSASRQS